MENPTGFLDYTRVNCPSRDAAARTGDYAPVELPLSERNRRRQSGRCMDCGVPFRQTVYVEQGYKSKVSCGPSIKQTHRRYSS